MSLYCLGLAVFLFVPAYVGKMVAENLFRAFFTGTTRAVAGSVTGAAILLLWGLVCCRLLIGFQPVATGRRPNFFNGWQLTAGHGGLLFLRALPAGVAVLMLFAAIFYIGILVELHFPEALSWNGSGSGQSGDGRIAFLSRHRHSAIVLVVSLIAATPLLWYLMVLFAETYKRLSSS